MRTMIRVYVCSPLSGDIEHNIEKAKEYSRYVIKEGKLPITPHIYFTQLLNDDDPEERKLGMKMGLELLDDCDMLWVFGRKITDGMKKEISYWKNTKSGGLEYFKKI